MCTYVIENFLYFNNLLQLQLKVQNNNYCFKYIIFDKFIEFKMIQFNQIALHFNFVNDFITHTT